MLRARAASAMLVACLALPGTALAAEHAVAITIDALPRGGDARTERDLESVRPV
jgi:hypothetical protein